MFTIKFPFPGTDGLVLSLVGVVSLRLFEKVANRLNIRQGDAMQLVQDRVNELMPQLKALPTTLGDSNRFLFAALPDTNTNPLVAPLLTTEDSLNEFLKEFPELKAPDVTSEEELFHYVVPDFTTIH